MGNRIEKLKGISTSTWNRVKTFGPWIIAQSQTLSENWENHQLRLADVRVDEAEKMSELKVREEARMAEVELVKDMAREQASEFVEARKVLIKKMADAEPAERARLQQDIEYVEGQTRQLSIAMKSFQYSESNSSTSDDDSEIEDHWVDTYNELTRKRNEDWRNELLARALAKESDSPGTVSPRALWAIGNLEREMVQYFSVLLDSCMWEIGQKDPVIPNSKVKALNRPSGIEGLNISHILYQLGDLGLVADAHAYRQYFPGGHVIFYHGKRGFLIRPKMEFKLRGIILTPLGNSIASFYSPNWNSRGDQILTEWVESISEEEATVGPVNINP